MLLLLLLLLLQLLLLPLLILHTVLASQIDQLRAALANVDADVAQLRGVQPAQRRSLSPPQHQQQQQSSPAFNARQVWEHSSCGALWTPRCHLPVLLRSSNVQRAAVGVVLSGRTEALRHSRRCGRDRRFPCTDAAVYGRLVPRRVS